MSIAVPFLDHSNIDDYGPRGCARGDRRSRSLSNRRADEDGDGQIWALGAVDLEPNVRSRVSGKRPKRAHAAFGICLLWDLWASEADDGFYSTLGRAKACAWVWGCGAHLESATRQLIDHFKALVIALPCGFTAKPRFSLGRFSQQLLPIRSWFVA